MSAPAIREIKFLKSSHLQLPLQKIRFMSMFEELGLNEKLVKAVTDLGFTEPTPIQAKAIPVLLSGTKDLIGLAQTGPAKQPHLVYPFYN